MPQTIMTPDALKDLAVNEVLEKLSASAGGLSEVRAKERWAEYGTGIIFHR